MADMDFLIAAREEALKAGNWPRFNAATRLIVEKENETELQIFPAGLQWVAPFVGGQKKWVRIEIDFLTVRSLERQRKQVLEAGLIPFFDLCHNHLDVTFLPKRFFWQDGLVAGVWVVGYLTDTGRAAIARGMRYVSPEWLPTNGFPVRVAANLDEPNMGGLVAEPAFDNCPTT